jgi:hypothetical protein
MVDVPARPETPYEHCSPEARPNIQRSAAGRDKPLTADAVYRLLGSAYRAYRLGTSTSIFVSAARCIHSEISATRYPSSNVAASGPTDPPEVTHRRK